MTQPINYRTIRPFDPQQVAVYIAASTMASGLLGCHVPIVHYLFLKTVEQSKQFDFEHEQI